MKKFLTTVLLLIILNAGGISAHLLYHGLRLPRFTEAERDRLSPGDNIRAKGLLIFNTDIKCVEFWNGSKWISLCESDGFGLSQYEVLCKNVHIYGEYRENTPLTSANYLIIDVDVAKSGAYSFAATTNNGYGFYLSGVFLAEGAQQLVIPGQGTPINISENYENCSVCNGLGTICSHSPICTEMCESPETCSACDGQGQLSIGTGGDTLHFSVNASLALDDCEKIIQVYSSSPVFAMDCGTVKVHGTYRVGQGLNLSNIITAQVDVTTVGNGRWYAETNTIDGIYFSGYGDFTTTGVQEITLFGYGVPQSPRSKTLIISKNNIILPRTCTAIVNMEQTFSAKRILSMGYATGTPFGGANNGTYGYNFNARASYNMLMSPNNFGTNPNSTVRIEKIDIIGLRGSSYPVTLPGSLHDRPLHTVSATATPSAASRDAFRKAMADKPDIIIIGWGMIYHQEMIDSFVNYVNNGGVMIIMNKHTDAGTTYTDRHSEELFFETLFGTPDAISVNHVRQTNGHTVLGNQSRSRVLPLLDVDDPILNGPFGDIRGLHWGNDHFPATVMFGLPESQITPYSRGNLRGSTHDLDGITMFRHNTLNLFWVGDGGFVSNSNANGVPIDVNIFPFATDKSTNRPLPRPYGALEVSGGVNIEIWNSVLIANVIAWAIERAEISGINTKN